MSDQMNVVKPEHLHEGCDVFYDRRHRVVLNTPWIVGIALAEAVDCNYSTELGKSVNVSTPICGAVGTKISTKITSVQENDWFSLSLFKVAGSNSSNIDVLLVVHRHLLASAQLIL
jgi:hypothetical protein